MMTDETRRFLIEQKVSYVNSTVHVSMSWWVSSIVFCGSVLAAIWLQREELRQQPRYVIGLGIVLFAFFFVIAYFGHLVARRLGRVQSEIAALAKQLGYVTLESEKGFFDTEIRTFQKSMWLGAGSFALIFLTWIVFWYFLSGESLYIFIGSIIWIVCWIIAESFLWYKQGAKKESLEEKSQSDNHQRQLESSQSPPNNSFNPTPRQQASQDSSSDVD